MSCAQSSTSHFALEILLIYRSKFDCPSLAAWRRRSRTSSQRLISVANTEEYTRSSTDVVTFGL